MTKLTGPLLSLRARQKLGDTIAFRDGASGPVATRKPIPGQPRTLPQVYHRQDYIDYARRWTLLTTAEKATYEALARRQNFTPYNAWMRTALTTLPDLAARYHLDTIVAGETPDSGPQNLPATVIGAITAPGIWGQALSFDGLDDYAEVRDSNKLDFTTDQISVEAWIKPEATSGPVVVTKYPGDGQGYALRIDPLWYQFSCFPRGSAQWNTALSTDWTHLIGTYDGAAIKLYADGILRAETATSGNIASSGINFQIGRYHWGAGFYEGLMDEIRVYNRPLAAEEVRQHYLRGAAALTT